MEDKIEKEMEERLQEEAIAQSGEPESVDIAQTIADNIGALPEIERVIELEDVTEAEPVDFTQIMADNIGALCVTMMQIRDHLENIAELILRQTGK